MQDLKKTIGLKSINKNLISNYFGLVGYEEALQIQLANHQKIKDGEDAGVILGFEHPDIIMLGYRADVNKEVKDSSIDVIKTSRGGLATIHSPGQLVIYPIINLRKINKRVKK